MDSTQLPRTQNHNIINNCTTQGFSTSPCYGVYLRSVAVPVLPCVCVCVFHFRIMSVSFSVFFNIGVSQVYHWFCAVTLLTEYKLSRLLFPSLNIHSLWQAINSHFRHAYKNFKRLWKHRIPSSWLIKCVWPTVLLCQKDPQTLFRQYVYLLATCINHTMIHHQWIGIWILWTCRSSIFQSWYISPHHAVHRDGSVRGTTSSLSNSGSLGAARKNLMDRMISHGFELDMNLETFQ